MPGDNIDMLILRDSLRNQSASSAYGPTVAERARQSYLNARAAFKKRQDLLNQQYATWLKNERVMDASMLAFPQQENISWETFASWHAQAPITPERLQAFDKILNTTSEENPSTFRDLLMILLGPRLWAAKAKATHIFFNPMNHFRQHCYEILLSVAQNYFQDAWQGQEESFAFEQLDNFHRSYLETHQLKSVLTAFIKIHNEIFPEWKESTWSFF